MGVSLRYVVGVVTALAVVAALVVVAGPLRRGGVVPVESKEVDLPQLAGSVNEFTVDILKEVSRERGELRCLSNEHLRSSSPALRGD